MGSAPSVDCCQPHVASHQFSSIVPSKIRAVVVLEENFLVIKNAVAKISFLSELDYYILKLKENEVYRNQFMQLFPSFEDLLQTVNYSDSTQWTLPIQTKTYNTAQPRFDPVNMKAYPLEMGVIGPHVQSIQALLTKGNLKKVQSMLLDLQFASYAQKDYVQRLAVSLKEWEGLDEFSWVIEPQATYEDMKHHLLYHWNRIYGFINSDLSLNDALSWQKAGLLYNFMVRNISNSPVQLLQPLYYIDNWLYEAETFLLSPGHKVVFFGFPQLAPYYQENIDFQDDLVRLSPPKGEEDVPKCKVKLLVQPLRDSGGKFRCSQNLYYMPLTMFVVKDVEQKYGQLFVYLKEQFSQQITTYLSKHLNNRPPNTNGKQKYNDMISELSSFRDQIASQIQQELQQKKSDQNCLSYYKNYVRNRLITLKEQAQPILTKKQKEICEEDVEIKIDQEPTLQQAESEPIWVQVTEQQTARLDKELQKYISRLNFQKLQTQIDNNDKFINMTTLNISQCWLERLECLHCFPNLIELFAYSNLISKMEGLEHNPNLRLLSLARNQIDVLENIHHLDHLRQLYLTKNKLELQSAVYLSNINLPKLKMLTISFKQQADECFEVLLRRPPPRLKQLLINEGDQLSNRTKNTLKRRLKGVDIQYIHG